MRQHQPHQESSGDREPRPIESDAEERDQQIAQRVSVQHAAGRHGGVAQGAVRRGREASPSRAAARVQLQAAGDAMSAGDEATATDAQATSSDKAMPPEVQAKMETAFGADFSAVRVHEGAEAGALGAVAYTRGTDIHFAPGRYDPDSRQGQELLGHELTHVVQQSQGRVEATFQARGVDLNDDEALEREADEMGARAARGESAAPGGTVDVGARGGGVLQRYMESTISGKPWRVSDDLTMAIRQDSKVFGSRHFYADPSLISSASAALGAHASHLSLKAGSGSMEVTSADGTSKKTLSRVEPTNEGDKSTGNAKTGMQWPDDCGEAANEVMQGPGREGKAVYHGPPSGWLENIVARFTGRRNFERETKGADYDADSMSYGGETFYSPHILVDEVIKAAVGEKDAATAWAKYQALSPSDREKFDQEVGINKYAQPEVGEAYSIVSDKDDFLAGKSAWNFHWGGVVMRSGGDSVTMENFANSGTDAWDFQMYGPPTKAGQTFHEQQEERTHGSTAEYGDSPTTIRVRKAD